MSSDTTVPVVPPPTIVDQALTTNSLVTTTAVESEGIGNYIIIAAVSVLIIVLLYYAYRRFTANKLAETFTKGVEQERDDTVADFNLRESIRDLQNIQKRVLSSLSEAYDC